MTTEQTAERDLFLTFLKLFIGSAMEYEVIIVDVCHWKVDDKHHMSLSVGLN